MSDCHFYISIYAPLGLRGIEKHMHHSNLPLVTHESGFNGKTILRSSNSEAWFVWSMDSSDTNLLVASGNISLPVDEAWRQLESLSVVLTASKFPHKLGIDDERGNMKHSFSFLWEKD